ncbi:MAG TPA: transcription termination factor Rho, partial [Saprospirales bacterium]|nr:transcription termination factor Rho [Saprospirales bacterium]
MLDILQLNDMLVPDLKALAEKLDLKAFKRLSKQDLIYKILDHQAITGKAPVEQETKKPSPKPRSPKAHRKDALSKKEVSPKKETPVKKEASVKREDKRTEAPKKVIANEDKKEQSDNKNQRNDRQKNDRNDKRNDNRND